MKVPKWILKYADFLDGALGTEDIDIALAMVPAPGSSGKNEAFTITEDRYNRATIEIRLDAEEGDHWYESITHEWVHVALLRLATSADRIIDLVPKELTGHAIKLWTDGNESSVHRLAKSLTPLFVKMYKLGYRVKRGGGYARKK